MTLAQCCGKTVSWFAYILTILLTAIFFVMWPGYTTEPMQRDHPQFQQIAKIYWNLTNGMLDEEQLHNRVMILMVEYHRAEKWLYYISHVLLAVLWAVIPLFQFSHYLRRKFPGFHTWAGRLWMVSSYVMAATGLYLGITTSYPSLSWYWASITFGIAPFYTNTRAWLSIRNNDIEGHQIWVYRSYLMQGAAPFFRPLLAVGATIAAKIDIKYIVDDREWFDLGAALLWLSISITFTLAEFVVIPFITQKRSEKEKTK